MNEENQNKNQNKPEESEQNGGQNSVHPPETTDIDPIKAKITELENNVAFYKDQLLRKVAEFDNYKKRTDSEYANFVRYANEEFIEKILPVVDDFERSLKAFEESAVKGNNTNYKENNSIVKGVELIYNKLKKVLESHGVSSMDVVGKPFDPHYHDALMQVETSEHPHHTVIQEVEKGYLLHDRVIRHAKVIVSSSPAGIDSEQPDEERKED